MLGGPFLNFGTTMATVSGFESLRGRRIEDFEDIGQVLDELERRPLTPAPDGIPFLPSVFGGFAFVTFAYDIDGVAMEIAKYGAALDALLREEGYRPAVHCIGGNFGDKVDVVLPALPRRHAAGQRCVPRRGGHHVVGGAADGGGTRRPHGP